MTHHVSVLMLRSPPGRLDAAIAQFTEGRVLETCRDEVPGFVSGRLLRSNDDPQLACVVCEWTDPAAFEQWMASPKRNAATPERVFEPSGRSNLFEVVQELRR